jgi:hypothetical protein
MTRVLETCDHVSYSDAQGQPEWEQAMQDEMNSLLKNHTWDLVPRPQGKNIVKCRWVYKTKFTSEGVVEHHKSHAWLQKDFLNKKESTTLRPFLLLQR